VDGGDKQMVDTQMDDFKFNEMVGRLFFEGAPTIKGLIW
jgi:hypothetical protein